MRHPSHSSPAQVPWVINSMENCSFSPSSDPGSSQWCQTQVCPRIGLISMLYCLPFPTTCLIPDQVSSFHKPKSVRTLCLVVLAAVASLPNSDSPTPRQLQSCAPAIRLKGQGRPWPPSAVCSLSHSLCSIFIHGFDLILFTFYYNVQPPRQ